MKKEDNIDTLKIELFVYKKLYTLNFEGNIIFQKFVKPTIDFSLIAYS